MSSSRPHCLCAKANSLFFAELTEFPQKLSEFSPLKLRKVPGATRSMRTPSCELWRSVAKFCDLWSGRAKRETAKGRTRNAHFCRFSLIFGSLCKSRDLGVADLRRKPQETADFRRKPQKTADLCRNRFLPFAVSLLARSYLANFWRTHSAIFTRNFLTFMSVREKAPHIHQGSVEGAVCTWVAFRRCPSQRRRDDNKNKFFAF